MPYAETDSFTTEVHVEAIVGRAISTTTNPTTADLLELMALRAGDIMNRLDAAGYPKTPPGGTNPVTAGSALARSLDLANALYVAHDISWAQETDKPNVFLEAADAVMANALAEVAKILGTTAAVLVTPEMDIDDLVHFEETLS